MQPAATIQLIRKTEEPATYAAIQITPELRAAPETWPTWMRERWDEDYSSPPKPNTIFPAKGSLCDGGGPLAVSFVGRGIDTCPWGHYLAIDQRGNLHGINSFLIWEEFCLAPTPTDLAAQALQTLAKWLDRDPQELMKDLEEFLILGLHESNELYDSAVRQGIIEE